MKDIKTLNNLAVDEYWPMVAFVTVEADTPARQVPAGASQAEAEEVVQSWQRVAILEVSSEIEMYFGFKVGGHAQFLNVPVETENGLFGARVGDGDVEFFVLPTDLKSRPSLRLVEVASVDDPKYETLPIY